MKLLAFAASSSKQSINKKLVTYAAGLVENAQAEIVDLNNYEIPMFSEDKEKELGQPDLARKFLSKIGDSDAVIISFAEHNGSYSVAYKNLFDWCSRISRDVFQGKPLVLLSTSPGRGGASNVLEMAHKSAKHFAGDVKATLSIPSFYDNFDLETGRITNREIQEKLTNVVQYLSDS